MRTVWKYPLSDGGSGVNELKMPKGATIVSAINQRNSLMLYAVVEPARPVVRRYVIVVKTGTNQPDAFLDRPHIASVSFYDGAYILHVFDQGEIT